jgi:hypothetical protein
MKEKLCAHPIDQIMLNDVGDYVIFSSNCFHRGYFSIQMDSIYYTAQMFATPSEKTLEEAFPTSRNTTIMKNQKVNVRCIVCNSQNSVTISKKIGKTQNTKEKIETGKKFDGQQINPSQHRHIFRKHFYLLKQLNAFVRTVESLHSHITIDSIWIMAKSNLAGNVGNMSATCRRQGKMSPIFVPTGQFWRHDF